MSGCQEDARAHAGRVGVRSEVGPVAVAAAVLVALAFVALTRWPVARPGPFETDEFGFLDAIRQYRLPMHHTLFLAAARLVGEALGDAYRGFVVLDAGVSALALAAVWWWLRALVRPATAVAATAVLGLGPVFWSYGAMAGNYAMIPLVGSVLLGIAARTWSDPRPWHPYVAAAVLALGAGYRQDIGTFWLPVLLLILWRHGWAVAVRALAVVGVLSLLWFVPMLVDVGGWARWRAASAEFSREAGFKNSVWNLGLVDAPVRYAVKLGMALVWTLGPALVFVPRGASRLVRSVIGGPWLAAAMLGAVLPAFAFHMLIHFGVAGYALHYVPALLGLAALGAETPSRPDRAPARLLAAAAVSALVFWFYPLDYDRPGLRGNFDLAFARQTRLGLLTRPPARNPDVWRTKNSRSSTQGSGGGRN